MFANINESNERWRFLKLEVPVFCSTLEILFGLFVILGGNNIAFVGCKVCFVIT